MKFCKDCKYYELVDYSRHGGDEEHVCERNKVKNICLVTGVDKGYKGGLDAMMERDGSTDKGFCGKIGKYFQPKESKEEPKKTGVIVPVLHPQSSCCMETNCAFAKSCANHCTAGGFREESGFSPDIAENNHDSGATMICYTKGQPAQMIDNEEMLPKDYNKMNRGYVEIYKKSS